jgi:hypothetical protein
VYSALSDILQTFSAAFPVPWALLVLVTVGATSLGLYFLWSALGGLMTWLLFGRAGLRKPQGK